MQSHSIENLFEQTVKGTLHHQASGSVMPEDRQWSAMLVSPPGLGGAPYSGAQSAADQQRR